MSLWKRQCMSETLIFMPAIVYQWPSDQWCSVSHVRANHWQLHHTGPKRPFFIPKTPPGSSKKNRCDVEVLKSVSTVFPQIKINTSPKSNECPLKINCWFRCFFLMKLPLLGDEFVNSPAKTARYTGRMIYRGLCEATWKILILFQTAMGCSMRKKKYLQIVTSHIRQKTIWI